MPDNLPHTLPVIDALSDVSDAAISVERLVIDKRPDSATMLLAGGVIGPFITLMIGASTRGILAIRVDTLAEIRLRGDIVLVITFEGIEAVSCAKDFVL